MARLELYVIPGGPYPRRVTIYLAEKELATGDDGVVKVTPVSTTVTLQMDAPGKPPGTVPILALEDGAFIKQSVAILEYLEDLYDSKTITSVRPTMRGTTPEERARTREVLQLADEATSYFSLACRKGSAMFTLREMQDPVTSKLAQEFCKKTMGRIEKYHNDGYQSPEQTPTIADCVLFSTMQFASLLYGIALMEGLPNLTRFYRWFEERPSAEPEGLLCDDSLRIVASHWRVEKKSVLGKVQELLTICGVYLSVVKRLSFKFPWSN